MKTVLRTTTIKWSCQQGLTLVELVIGLAILAILVTMAAPSFGLWMQNARIRTAAESMQNGLQQAKAEAVRRNAAARFQLTSTLDNSCVLTNTGQNWVINMTADATPAGACGQANDDSTSPYLLQSSPAGQVSSNVSISATQQGTGTAQAAVAFNSLGRLTTTTNPTTTVGTLQIDISSPSGTCLASSGGTVRCLRILVSPAGQIRMCDPSINSASSTTMTEAMKCV